MTKYNILALLIGPPAFVFSVATGSWIYFGIALPIVIALSVFDKNQSGNSEKDD